MCLRPAAVGKPVAALLFAGLVALAVSTILIGQAQRETAGALLKEQVARRDADHQRDIAEKERGEANKQRADADKQRDIAEQALLENRRISANLAFDRARTLSEDGQPDIGLHWYVRAMELSPQDDTDFHDLIRTALTEWKRETVSLQLHYLLSRGGYPDGAQLSSDGTFLFMAFRRDVGVVQWNTTTAEANLLLLPGVETTLEEVTGGGTTQLSEPIALSPSETVCAAGIENNVYFWNVGDGTLIGDPITVESIVTALDYDPSGQMIAVGCADGKYHLFDVDSRQPLGMATAHEAEIRVVEFRHDGEVLMTAGYDQTVRRWDPATREEIEPAFKHDLIGVNSAAWSPDGKQIVSSDMATVKVWDVESGQPIESIEANGGAYDIEFSKDGTRLALAVGDGTVRIMDAQSFQLLYHPILQNDAPHFVAFDASSQHVFTLGAVPYLRKWRLPTGPLKSKNISGPHNRMDIDPSGSKVALGGMKGALVLCDTDTGEHIFEPLNYQEPIASVTFNHNGELLLVTGFLGLESRLLHRDIRKSRRNNDVQRDGGRRRVR